MCPNFSLALSSIVLLWYFLRRFTQEGNIKMEIIMDQGLNPEEHSEWVETDTTLGQYPICPPSAWCISQSRTVMFCQMLLQDQNVIKQMFNQSVAKQIPLRTLRSVVSVLRPTLKPDSNVYHQWTNLLLIIPRP